MTKSDPPHDASWQSSRWRSRLRKRLLDWFAENARSLPWRTVPGGPLPDPYRVWVSEIMLQQTQVTTVIPYYLRFIDRFPTVRDLAEVDESTLMSFWEGLGYYRRARALHAAAKRIRDHHEGRFPTTFTEVLSLPGIGRYTAGAILSISLDHRLPILEGNTQRVFSRWIASRGELSDRSTIALLWQVAEAMLPRRIGAKSDDFSIRRGPGAFNQAAMELGALICTPRDPKCMQCPVQAMCCAKLAGLAQSIPGKVKQVDYEDRTEFAFVIRDRRNRYLVRRLQASERWAGLWDFPRVTTGSFEHVDAAAEAIGQSMSATILPSQRIATLKHVVTRYRIQLDVHAATISRPDGKSWRATSSWCYRSLDELAQLPMSVTGRKIVSAYLTQLYESHR